MLNVYYGRESVNKEGFMFGKIRKQLKNPGHREEERIVILVPDQYTLQGERNALENLEAPGLMDLEILSRSRLAMRVLSEVGGVARVRIDKRGRHMLLRGILEEEKSGLLAFRGLESSHGFIDMINDQISELKQYNTAPEDLLRAIDDLEDDPLLAGKLMDVHRIFSRYQEKIQGSYVDSEDYLDLFTLQIEKSSMIRNTSFWISGFFSFTPKTIKMIKELICWGREVNVILTGNEEDEFFELTRKVVYDLRKIAGELGVVCREEEITAPGWEPPKAAALEHLERELYAYPSKTFPDNRAIKFCRAANFYAEVETAAAEILTLVREKEMRYRDIAVICNDMEERGPIAKRIFEEYGIPVFTDVKRGVLHNPVVTLLLSLLDLLDSNWIYEDVFLLLKTGLLPIPPEDWEDLENYAVKYKIRGRRWKSEFRYGAMDQGREELERLNGIRTRLTDLLEPFERGFQKAQTVREKTGILYYYLRDVLEIPGRVEQLQLSLEEKGAYEQAIEMGQIWDVVIDLLDQLVELSGEAVISGQDYAAMVRSGFEAVEVGVIPPASDQMVMGTMQRTRVGRVKAMFVLGANDGILPAGGGQKLLNDDERVRLLGRSHEICEDSNQMVREEQLAIYKNLSAPERLLWMGFSVEDTEGREIRPSMIFDKLREIFPETPLKSDLLNREDPMGLIQGEQGALKHLTAALQKDLRGEEPLAEPWKAAVNWYRQKESRPFAMMGKGLFFKNSAERLEKKLAKELFGKEEVSEAPLAISPSRLERFSRCPFSHMVLYGFRPEDRRVFEIAGREVGDVYHECLMRLSAQLTKEGVAITDSESPWMLITKEECYAKVEELIKEIAAQYREGMLLSGQEEIYRAGRMKDVCAEAAWALITHVRQGSIQKMFFEESFGEGPGKRFPPIRIHTGEHLLQIEGKVDRADILPGGYVKIIDYKAGKETFQIGEAKGGWRLQLMLYLRAVMDGIRQEEEREVKPAGVFYFEIADPLIDADELSGSELAEKVEGELRKSFKLNGILLSEPDVINGIAGEFSGFSEILPLRKNSGGGVSETGKAGSRLLNEEQFRELCQMVDKTVEDLCVSLAEGNVEARPKRTKYETACTFCQYKSICNFDITFEGCSYEMVKAE